MTSASLLVTTVLIGLLLCSLVLGKSSSSESNAEKVGSEDKKKVSEEGGRIFGNWINTDNLFPNVNPTPVTGTGVTTPTPSGIGSIFGGNDNFGLPGTIGTVGASAVLVSRHGATVNPRSRQKRTSIEIKGGFLTLLTAIKSIVVPAVLTLLLIAFLIAGAAFFTCSLVDCQGSLGGLTGAKGGFNPAVGSPQLDRQTLDYYDQFRPMYQAIDEGHQKYGTPSSSMQSNGKSQ